MGITHEVSWDWRFQPPNTLLKQEGLQLAKASCFRDDVCDVEEVDVDDVGDEKEIRNM